MVDIDIYKDLIKSTLVKIESIENMLDHVKEEELIDSYIYDLKSAKIQHTYLIKKIKEINKESTIKKKRKWYQCIFAPIASQN